MEQRRLIDRRLTPSISFLDFSKVRSPFFEARDYPSAQVNIFMALATMVSYKAATTVRVAKFAAEDAWLLGGNKGPIIDAVL